MPLNKPVLLYIPNLIIYTRVIFLFFGMIHFFDLPMITAVCFCISANLDAIDGFLARKLHQESKTGALFDFVLDRVSTTCYLFFLSILFSHFSWLFLSILLLDLTSHFSHIYAFGFSQGNNHKNIKESRSKIFNGYYHNKLFLFYCCASYEFAFLFLYLTYWENNYLLYIAISLCIPGFFLKNYVHLIQFFAAIKHTLALDDAERASVNTAVHLTSPTTPADA